MTNQENLLCNNFKGHSFDLDSDIKVTDIKSS